MLHVDANLYEDAANATSNKTLKASYLQTIAELDGDFLEYLPGHFIAPQAPANVYYQTDVNPSTGEEKAQIFTIINGMIVSPAQTEDIHTARHIFQGLTRNGMMAFDKELINPRNMAFIDFASGETGTEISYLNRTLNQNLTLDDASQKEALIAQILDRNPNYVQAGSVLVNLDQIEHAYFNDQGQVISIAHGRSTREIDMDDAARS